MFWLFKPNEAAIAIAREQPSSAFPVERHTFLLRTSGLDQRSQQGQKVEVVRGSTGPACG